MATMTKTQRDYAVRRAAGILRVKHKKIANVKRPTDNEVLNTMGFSDIESTYNMQYCVTFCLDNHEYFSAYRKTVADMAAKNSVIEKAYNAAVHDAKDFIMLGDAADVLAFIKTLD